MPFQNAWERAIHFAKHGAAVGAPTAEDYERMADAFMFGLMNAQTRECVRPNFVDRLRFKTLNRHFGVACIQPEFLRTFYPVGRKLIAKYGGDVPYFRYECGRKTA